MKKRSKLKDANLIVGRFDAKKGGYGFVIPENGQLDIFIPPHSTHTALNGDRVVAVMTKRKRREGKIVKVLKRESKIFTGILRKESGVYFIDPIDDKISVPFITNDNKKIKSGTPVFVKLKKWKASEHYPRAEIIEKIDISKIDSSYIIKKLNIRTKYQHSVKSEVQEILNKRCANNQIDLTEENIFTIDPDDAKDYDDAVSIKTNGNGYELSVHISDVSFWIEKGSGMDKEAEKRGCSVYLPDRVINMFHPEVVEKAMSLTELTKKPAITVRMHLNQEGMLKKYEIFESIIINKKRMTYKEAQSIIERGKGEFAEDLREMDRLAQMLYNKRKKKGALDFDVPEMKIKFGENGKVMPPEIQERLPSHRLIEEFMILANEVVARYIFSNGRPGIYRAHASPDITKIENFFQFASSLGFNAEDNGIKGIQEVLEEARGTIYERIVNYTLLRSMKRARYVAFQSKHYGLASEFYTHFTSPIRRYPDLVVHRILKSILHRKKSPYSQEEIIKIADMSTESEWKSDEAERSSVELYILRYLKTHKEKEYEGIITDVFPAGLQIELLNFIISGTISIQELPPDDYRYREKLFLLEGKYHKFKLGDRILVKINSVDIITQRLEFEYIGLIRRRKR